MELPGLIAAVDQRLGLTTLRVGVHVDAWDHIPHRVQAGGRQVKVGWFHSADPRLVTLTFAEAEPHSVCLHRPFGCGGIRRLGLGVLVGIQRRAKTMGITLSLTAARPYMYRLLRVTGLGRTIPMLT